jgi:hypothetical protein
MSDGSGIEWTDATWKHRDRMHAGQPGVRSLLHRTHAAVPDIVQAVRS